MSAGGSPYGRIRGDRPQVSFLWGREETKVPGAEPCPPEFTCWCSSPQYLPGDRIWKWGLYRDDQVTVVPLGWSLASLIGRGLMGGHISRRQAPRGMPRAQEDRVCREV